MKTAYTTLKTLLGALLDFYAIIFTPYLVLVAAFIFLLREIRRELTRCGFTQVLWQVGGPD